MQRTFALLNPVQFVPGQPPVMIPVQQVLPNMTNLEQIDTTREVLVTTPEAAAALAAIEDAIVTEAHAALVERYQGDTIEVLTAAQWTERQLAATVAP